MAHLCFVICRKAAMSLSGEFLRNVLFCPEIYGTQTISTTFILAHVLSLRRSLNHRDLRPSDGLLANAIHKQTPLALKIIK
jgi:hypothetical protein